MSLLIRLVNTWLESKGSLLSSSQQVLLMSNFASCANINTTEVIDERFANMCTIPILTSLFDNRAVRSWILQVVNERPLHSRIRHFSYDINDVEIKTTKGSHLYFPAIQHSPQPTKFTIDRPFLHSQVCLLAGRCLSPNIAHSKAPAKCNAVPQYCTVVFVSLFFGALGCGPCRLLLAVSGSCRWWDQKRPEDDWADVGPEPMGRPELIGGTRADLGGQSRRGDQSRFGYHIIGRGRHNAAHRIQVPVEMN